MFLFWNQSCDLTCTWVLRIVRRVSARTIRELWKARFITHMYTLGDRVMSWMKEREFSSVQFTQSSPSLCDPVDSTPGFPVHHQLPELTQTHVIELVMPSNYFILCRPLLLPPSVFPRIRVFSNQSALWFRGPSIGALASASVLPINIQG